MANQNVPFVQRLFNPGIFPTINNPDGSYSSHKMGWGQSGNKYYAYPNIDYFNGKLTDFSVPPWNRRFAFDEAMKNKNYIEFGSGEEADYFGKNYKEGLKFLENESGGDWWSRILSGE